MMATVKAPTMEDLMGGLSDSGRQELQDPILHALTTRLLKRLEENRSYYTELGMKTMEDKIIQGLNQRGEIADHVQECPQILETEIKRPIVIVSMPRTGSTLFHNLLSKDPHFKVPIIWEMLNLVPCPKEDELLTDPRCLAMQKLIEMKPRIPNVSNKMHEFSATKPEDNAFVVFPKCGWQEWLVTQDNAADTYANLRYKEAVEILKFVKVQLQVLAYHQDHKDRRIVMMDHFASCPIQSGSWFDAYREVFPDITFIQTVRNPAKNFPSWAALIASIYIGGLHHTLSEEEGKVLAGKRLQGLAKGISKTLAAFVAKCKEQGTEGIAATVRFEDLMEDPLREIEKMYDVLGHSLQPETRQDMELYLRDNQRHKFGKYTYKMEDFGLSREFLAEATKEYCQLYQYSV